ncbi:MAG TPA: OmpH family outer membrane protein [Flavitalea sp.]|nr:OmpH family outer membrane protein [Flavitalea sp.]
MKNISTFLSIIALVLVGILYYLHFSSKDNSHKVPGERSNRDSSNFRIAYFDIDSLQEHYQYFKDVSNDMKSKENAMASELSGMQATYQKKIREWQQKGPNMSQTEGEAAQREYAQMQQRYEQRQTALDQDLQKQKMEMMTDVRKKIETYLSDYNKTKGYAFILSYEPGFMLYYKDSTFDITNDVIKGLNDQYKQQKK